MPDDLDLCITVVAAQLASLKALRAGDECAQVAALTPAVDVAEAHPQFARDNAEAYDPIVGALAGACERQVAGAAALFHRALVALGRRGGLH